MQERDENTRPRTAGGMPERNRATIDVGDLRAEAEPAHHTECLSGERLVQLDQTDSVE